jgi:hypothetical protein
MISKSLFITATVLFAAVASLTGETVTVALPELLGTYGLLSQKAAPFDLGTSFKSIDEVRIQCSGTLTPGLGHGDGVEVPADEWFEIPAQFGFGMDPGPGWWSALVGPCDGPFAADEPFHKHSSATWDFLLDGRGQVGAGLTPFLSFGTTIVIFPSGSIDQANLFVNGVDLIPGDANRDGVVNVGDLGILGKHYGTTEGANWGMGDFTRNGAVGIDDLGVLGAHYGEGSGSGTVPEPTALGLACLGAMFLAARKRRR